MASIINKSVLSIPVIFEKIEDVNNADERFTRVKVFLMHLGENFNKSIFDKDVVETAISTLQYIPIVGFIEKSATEKDDFTDHKYIVVQRDDKGVKRKYMGHAYGVILSNEDNNAHFEMRLCDDGIEREFLCVNGVIWNMFEDSSKIMNRDLIKGHSMELWEDGIEGYEDENEVFHFTKFSFRAACILGDSVSPAMINSTIEVQFSLSDFINDIQVELNDKYTAFTKIIKNNKGGNETMPNVITDNNDFALSVMQQFENIAQIVRDREMIKDRWGDAIPRYSLADIQDNEVIVIDRKDGYNYYGFTFTIEGDAPVINFDKGIRKKIVYENYEDSVKIETPVEGAFSFSKEIQNIEDRAFSKINTANEEVAIAKAAQDTAEANYTNLQEQYNEIKPKYDAYVKADEEHQAAILAEQKNAEFKRFEGSLGTNADFIALKDKIDELSVEEITSQCSVLYAKLSLEGKINYSKDTIQNMTLGIMDNSEDDEEHFVYSARYGNIPVGR